MPKKITIKVQVRNEKTRSKAMKIAADRPGVNSVSIEGDGRDQLVVIGEGVDSVKLTNVLRKKLGDATIMRVQDVKKKKDGDDEVKPWPFEYIYYSPYPHTPYLDRVVYDSQPTNSCSVM